jgi:hypothetical protein
MMAPVVKLARERAALVRTPPGGKQAALPSGLVAQPMESHQNLHPADEAPPPAAFVEKPVLGLEPAPQRGSPLEP